MQLQESGFDLAKPAKRCSDFFFLGSPYECYISRQVFNLNLKTEAIFKGKSPVDYSFA
jgi:hypothetical protein